jgi:hypothetical protein
MTRPRSLKEKTGRSATQADGLTSPRSTCCFNVVRFVCANRANRFSGKYSGMVELDCCIAVVFLRQRFCQRTWPLLPVGATLGLRLNYEFPKAAGLFPFLSPEHHNYPNYYHHRNPRSPYDIDRSPVWYVQKLCHHYCEPANHPPRFALSLHGVRRVGRFNALALLKSRDAPLRLAPPKPSLLAFSNRHLFHCSTPCLSILRCSLFAMASSSSYRNTPH